MSKSSRGVIAVLALGGALGIGVAIVGIRSCESHTESAVTREQIDEWRSHWHAMRACVLGAEPHAADTVDALLLREAIDGVTPEELRDCLPHVRKLSRPGEHSTGNAAVEAAWDDVKTAVSRMARTFANRVDPSRPDRFASTRNEFAEGIAAVEVAYAALRERAGLPPEPAPASAMTIEPLLPPEELALAPAHDSPGAWMAFGGNTARVYAEDASTGATTIAALRGPGAAEVWQASPNTRVAFGDHRWGVWFETTPTSQLELRGGPLAEDGTPAGDGAVVHRVPAGQDMQVYAALAGPAAESRVRAVLLEVLAAEGESGQPALAVSTDGGTRWRLLPLSWRQHLVDDVRERVDLLGESEDGQITWTPLRPETLADTVPPTYSLVRGDRAPAQRCMSGPSSWWLADDGNIYHAREGGDAARAVMAMAAETLAACTADRAYPQLITDHGRDVLECNDTACRPILSIPMPVGVDLVRVVAEDGAPPRAVTRMGDLLLVWRVGSEGQEVSAFRLPKADLVTVEPVSWGGKLHLVTRGTNGVQVLPVPLRT